MLQIEIDGKEVAVPQGSTVMEAANTAGTYIPHFCYHKKLSIAANCRMCLVEVEKAPKPLPACATPVTDGMKVHTHSQMAQNAQKGVMEFLLINHPLDCPICDQGGECQLQDLSVGYGNSTGRYQEAKRAVVAKDMGPLVSAQEMSRCIHCTRCVRFTEEIAGQQEIGMANRGEFSQIMPFVGKVVETELSGNVIDLCPVGALTSKPFRYSARSWELSRRKSIAPHDALGSNLIVQVKDHEVKRVLPLENDEINECWLSDKDRFSYEGLNSEERLQRPMIKHGGVWHEVEWQTALEYVVKGLKGVANDHGKDAIACLLNPTSTLEEAYLAKKLTKEFGVENIESRLRQQDFKLDGHIDGVFWLGQSIQSLLENGAVFSIGATWRSEQPLLTARIRGAAQKGLKLSSLNAVYEELNMPVVEQTVEHPLQWLQYLQRLLIEVRAQKAGQKQDNGIAKVAQSLLAAEKSTVLLGGLAQNHPDFAQLSALAQNIAQETNSVFGFLPQAGNSVGVQAMIQPHKQTKFNTRAALTEPKKAYVLVNIEVDKDLCDGNLALKAMEQAETVIAFTAYKDKNLLNYADVLLPVAPFTETAGSFVNMEGKLQSFFGVVRPLAQTRPLWKVLRVLGNMLELSGFEFDSVEQVREEALAQHDLPKLLNNHIQYTVTSLEFKDNLLYRVGNVGLYESDAIVRRAISLQQTVQAQVPTAILHSRTLSNLGFSVGEAVQVCQENGQPVCVVVSCDDRLPENVVSLAHHAHTCTVGALLGEIELKRG
ncbi:NADH-quinone oxidoreductase subunit NuoG [Neisseria sp. Ec49-e6-T10]|uniref:NADH-quinone oxidoreductase subunit NuoG n=1 Tax=Neisseria sp. Ec49-e6-T10 TaxID=3140744 RepID=UPI003EB83ADF